MADIKELLRKISKIVVREKTQQEERRKRGENFNIFKVLGLSTSEVRLHSAFLAELLKPDGDHGLGEKFLQAFINEVVKPHREDFVFDASSAKVYVEYDIGSVSTNYDEGGRLDLMIQDKNRQTIVIENKIYAGDQPKQLFRYNRYLTEKAELGKEKYALLYLTLDGSAPSEHSTGECPSFCYDCISYKDNIIHWLKSCVGIAALLPSVRETIAQYVTNLNQIMNIMSEMNKNELMELLKENLSAAVSILGVEGEIRKAVRHNYITSVISPIAEKQGFKIDSPFDDFVNMIDESIVSFSYVSGGKEVFTDEKFVLGCYGGASNSVYYGIMSEKGNLSGGKTIWPDGNGWLKFPYGIGWIANAGTYCYWDRNLTIAQLQKEIDMATTDYPEGTIAKEIEDQLMLTKEHFGG